MICFTVSKQKKDSMMIKTENTKQLKIGTVFAYTAYVWDILVYYHNKSTETVINHANIFYPHQLSSSYGKVICATSATPTPCAKLE